MCKIYRMMLLWTSHERLCIGVRCSRRNWGSRPRSGCWTRLSHGRLLLCQSWWHSTRISRHLDECRWTRIWCHVHKLEGPFMMLWGCFTAFMGDDWWDWWDLGPCLWEWAFSAVAMSATLAGSCKVSRSIWGTSPFAPFLSLLRMSLA